MVKNLLYTALWLMGLMGILIVSTPSVNAYEDWIYTWVDEYWNEVKTVIFWWNDTFPGVQLTIKMENQTWIYHRWYDETYNNSIWSDDYWTWTYMSGDGKMYWWTNWVNNSRWWGEDVEENWYTPRPTNFDERQWPCDTWYHVPSKWEWALLSIAWCNLSTWCNARSPDVISGGVAWDIANYDIETSLVVILNVVSNFKDEFGISPDDYYFWSSSPGGYNTAMVVDLFWVIQIMRGSYRGNAYSVRCFKNSIVAPAPQTFTLTFLDDDKYVRSGEIESWGAIPVDIISWYNLTWLTKEWYAFSWWIISWSNEMFDVENDVVTTWMTLNAARNINQYTITFDTDWWSEIEPITADYWTWISVPANPTKNGYKFVSWNKEIPTTMPAENLTIKAIWEKLWSSGWWGGRSSKTSSNSEKSTEWQAWNQQPLSPQQASDSSPNREQTVTPLIGGDGEARGGSTQNYTPEFISAYEFAHEKWITTMPTIQEAQMNGKLTRIAMAKMLSQYAMNVLWQKPANIVTPKFNDVTDKQNSDYDDWVTLAYQLWIMWQNMPNNKFRPDDEVTRAEFATALSRMAYWTSDGEYKWTWKYYIHHMEKLVKEWIITNDNPTMKELRWYVMIMLKRSAK